MKKLGMISSIFIIILAVAILLATYWRGTAGSASGIPLPVPQSFMSEPLGLMFLGLGIISLARIVRKRFLRP